VKATRREALMGALAMPAVAALPGGAMARGGGGAVLLHDPSLEAGRRLAQAHQGEVLTITGDRIRFARAVFAQRPALVIGVSRAADALLIEDVGREAGYLPAGSSADALLAPIADAQARDRGLVLGWVLAPKP
jgi:hypothetical protein